MLRRRVHSRFIASIGYDPKTETLEIEFIRTGRTRAEVWQYHPFSERSWDEMLYQTRGPLAPMSLGTYFARYIRGIVPGIKLEGSK